MCIVFLGSFDRFGYHEKINSLVYWDHHKEYYVNFILDELLRPVMLYTTNKNFINENIILKIDYPDSENVLYSVHDYNWKYLTDSLVFQQVLNTSSNDSKILFGKNTNNDDKDYWEKVDAELNIISSNFEKVFNQDALTSYRYSNFLGKVAHTSSSLITANIIVKYELDAAINHAKTQALFSLPVKPEDYSIISKKFENSIFSDIVNALLNKTKSPSAKPLPILNGKPQKPCSNPLVGKWKRIGYHYFGYDIWDEDVVVGSTTYSKLPESLKDDIYLFKHDFQLLVDEGMSKGAPNDPQTYMIPYVTTPPFSVFVLNYFDDSTYTCKIVQIDTGTLVFSAGPGVVTGFF